MGLTGSRCNGPSLNLKMDSEKDLWRTFERKEHFHFNPECLDRFIEQIFYEGRLETPRIRSLGSKAAGKSSFLSSVRSIDKERIANQRLVFSVDESPITKAGIPEDKLTIALEPEAASLYCRHLPVEKCGIGKTSLASFGPRNRYLILDAGGGTVDITVHEAMRDGQLKEIHKASGRAWGGTKVDDAFMVFQSEIAGQSVISQREEYLDHVRDFEVKKREIGSDKDSKVTDRVPTALANHVQQMREAPFSETIPKSKYASQAGIPENKLTIALDSKASSLYWRHLPVEKCGIGKTSPASFGPGKRYFVLDAGDGKVDITDHEVMRDGQLKEIHKASGEAWGGTKLPFPSEITGQSAFSQLKQTYREVFLDLVREFEGKKIKIGPYKESKVFNSFRVPTALADLVVHQMRGAPFSETIQKSKYASQGEQFLRKECQETERKIEDVLEKETPRLEHLVMCKICLDVDASVVFLPCTHMVACGLCAGYLQRCPLCRAMIDKVLYINLQ